MAKLPEIASLWIGGRLSWLEQLCLKSFADAGHHTTLYSYEEIPNVPEGVHTADAGEIFPGEPMYRHVRTGSPAIHADIWRLNLLKKTDKIWVDADIYCYRPFNYTRQSIFGWEKEGLLCNAVLGLPKSSRALNAMLDFFEDEYAIGPWLKPWQQRELQAEKDAGRPVHMTAQNWGFTGPAAVTYFLNQSGEIKYAEPEAAFYPVSFKDRNKMIQSRFDIEKDWLTEDTRGVHFWARRMKPRLEEKEDNRPRRGSFMHGLLKKHDIDPDAALILPKKKAPDASGTANSPSETSASLPQTEPIANVSPVLAKPKAAALPDALDISKVETKSAAPSRSDWKRNLQEVGAEQGFFEELGAEHSALYIEQGKTLIVTFENLDHVYEDSAERMPWGHNFVTSRGWSMLGLMAHGWTWYRDEAVFDFFDRLRDEGFFEQFDKVVFYGASMGAYAAAAFSSAAPGATVICISPQATLDRETASWETRYRRAWHRDFGGRYGYAPDLISEAKEVNLFYDPRMPADAMHAALFRGDNLRKYRCRFMGHRIASLWILMGLLKPVIEKCVAGEMNASTFYGLMRQRREVPRYQKEMLQTLNKDGRPWMIASYCEAVLARRRGPHFRKALRAARAKL